MAKNVEKPKQMKVAPAIERRFAKVKALVAKPEPVPLPAPVEAEPTFSVPPEPLVVVEGPPPTPLQVEGALMLSGAQATVNELACEVVDKAAARVLAIRVIQSAKVLIDMLK